MEISAEKVEHQEHRQHNADRIPMVSAANFGEESIHCRCQHCKENVMTDVDHISTWISILIFFMLFLVLGVFVLCVFPCISSLTKDTVHQCPNCKQVLCTVRRFRLPTISHEIITIRCGSCALILSKRYVFCFALTVSAIALISIYQWYIRHFGFPDIPQGDPINNTWVDFLDDCGKKSYLGNHLNAQRNFDNIYYGKSIGWEGRLHSVKEGWWQKNFLYVNMDPHQFRSFEDPDMLLMFNAPTFNEIIAQIQVGDQIVYNATLIELGIRGAPHLGILHYINRTQSNSELSPLFGQRSPFFYIDRPPIQHVKQIRQKLGDIRNEFRRQQTEGQARGGYVVGDQLIV